jgi:hypothetical protein
VFIYYTKNILPDCEERIHSALDGSGPIIKIESERRSVIKISNMAPEVGEFTLKPGPVVLDRVEVRRIRRQVEQLTADIFDDFADTRGLMECGVIHDDGLPGTQFWA